MDKETSSRAVQVPCTVVVMGVSGSGKTVIGRALAMALGARFAEGDRFHPPDNIRRMSAGLPLRDEDRWGWLDAIAIEIAEAERNGEKLVVACSALKRSYRDRLRQASPHLKIVYLEIGRELAAARIAARKDHFMPASLTDSQFADLEPPATDENAITINSSGKAQVLVAEIRATLASCGFAPDAASQNR
jgi:gluconokinase